MTVRPYLAASALAAFALCAANGAQAAAATYSFKCVTNISAANCNDGRSTLSMSVTPFGSNQVDFTFKNSTALNSSITEIYFQDGTLLGIASLLDSGAGVTFSQVGSANPGNLPGGNTATPPFVATQGFMVDTGNGGPSKGVQNTLDGGAQEFVTIRFNLINNKTYSDTLDALNGPLGDGNDLRVGVHLVSYSTNGLSESYIDAVPEPSSYALLLAGLGFIGYTWNRRKPM